VLRSESTSQVGQVNLGKLVGGVMAMRVSQEYLVYFFLLLDV